MRKAEQPKGRSLRSRLTDEFITSLAADFEVHGQAALEKVREENPAQYVRLAADLVPREHTVAIEPSAPFENIDEALETLAQLFASDPDRLQLVNRRVKQIIAERQATAPRESATEHRARIAKEARAQIPWTAIG